MKAIDPDEGYKEFLGAKIVSVLGFASLIFGLITLGNWYGFYFLGFGILMLAVGVYFYLKRF